VTLFAFYVGGAGISVALLLSMRPTHRWVTMPIALLWPLVVVGLLLFAIATWAYEAAFRPRGDRPSVLALSGRGSEKDADP
jgi:hypothetical protein